MTYPHPSRQSPPEGVLERSGKPPSGGSSSVPDPELPAQARRRRFSAKFKLRIVEEARRCSKPGEVGALLRREGLYSSHLATWRKLYDRGALKELRDGKRGRKKDPARASKHEIERLEREIERLNKKLWKAEKVIEVQKKLTETLEALRLEEKEQE